MQEITFQPGIQDAGRAGPKKTHRGLKPRFLRSSISDPDVKVLKQELEKFLCDVKRGDLYPAYKGAKRDQLFEKSKELSHSDLTGLQRAVIRCYREFLNNGEYRRVFEDVDLYFDFPKDNSFRAPMMTILMQRVNELLDRNDSDEASKLISFMSREAVRLLGEKTYRRLKGCRLMA